MRWLRVALAVSVATAVVAACSSSDDAKPSAPRPDASFMPDRPVNEVVDGGSCPNPYPGPGPEILTRTPAVDQAVEAIYAIRPDLKYIDKLKREYPGGDGPRILPFEVTGGFDIVMIRADACDAACTVFEYWYFEARGAEPTFTATEVGHYLPPEPPTACDSDAGTAMWNSPLALPCDDGGTPDPAITGTKSFCATGTLGTCTEATKTTRDITVDFATDSVTLHGTGSSSLDEKTFAATYSRNHVNVTIEPTSQEMGCPKTVKMDFDFKAGSNGTITLVEAIGCVPDGSCTASTQFTLSAP